MRLIFSFFFLLIFIEVSAQEEKNTESDIFYKEDAEEVSNKKNSNESSLRKADLYNQNNLPLINDFVQKNKPIFLTGNSFKTKNYLNDRYNNYNNKVEYYDFIYEKEYNELEEIPIDERKILYFSRVINDTVFEAKSDNRIFYLYKRAFQSSQISKNPIEFDDDYLLPVIYYFSHFKYEVDFEKAVRCFVISKLNIYKWKSEFEMRDYSDNLTQKIINDSKERLDLSNVKFYKDIIGRFDDYNFERSTYSVDLLDIVSVSNFFKNEFNSTISSIKENSNYTINGNKLYFKCNQDLARKISDLFDDERKVYIKINLMPFTNSRLCSCNYNYNTCYNNDFIIKSITISNSSSFEGNVVTVNF